MVLSQDICGRKLVVRAMRSILNKFECVARKLFITSTNDCTFFRENNGGGDKCDVRCSTLPADLVNEFETAVADVSITNG